MNTPTKHAAYVQNRFSKLEAYDRKLDEAGDDGLWSDRYPEFLELYARLYRKRNAHVASTAAGGKRLLDVGCGLGDLLVLLADSYDELHGIDPSESLCQHARRCVENHVPNPLTIREGVSEELDYADGYFDTVTLLDVFEHIENDWRCKALQEIHRVLRPGGELILSTPSRHILRFWNVFDNVVCLPSHLRHGKPPRIWRFIEKEHHEDFVSRREMFKALGKAGFKITEFRRVGFYPAPERTGFLDPWLPRIHSHPRLHGFFQAAFQMMENAGALNQKMNIRALKPETKP